ncbi:MAG TPA: chromate transporter [Stellaceae bacterium]|jgi:chromate transporter|nr:chromate transporter [Stellaceae bacterium]
MSEAAVAPVDAPPSPSTLQLALTFNRIALASVGGGLSAWSRQVVVEDRGWMTDEEFLSAMTICRVLPGANQVNLAVFVGTKLRGASGALAAVCGLLALPVMIVLGLGAFYLAHRGDPSVQAALRGVIAASVALSLSMAYKTGRKELRSWQAWLLFGAAFLFSAIFRVPLLALLAVLAPAGLFWAWPRRPAA